MDGRLPNGKIEKYPPFRGVEPQEGEIMADKGYLRFMIEEQGRREYSNLQRDLRKYPALRDMLTKAYRINERKREELMEWINTTK